MASHQPRLYAVCLCHGRMTASLYLPSLTTPYFMEADITPSPPDPKTQWPPHRPPVSVWVTCPTEARQQDLPKRGALSHNYLLSSATATHCVLGRAVHMPPEVDAQLVKHGRRGMHDANPPHRVCFPNLQCKTTPETREYLCRYLRIDAWGIWDLFEGLCLSILFTWQIDITCPWKHGVRSVRSLQFQEGH